ncbi:MAG: type I methionyl aminopeptidase [Deltaproteobacteria bacterium]|nr:type I methionyl aminopeptidase [Deltaproteobacteria bacterium]
MREAGLRLSLVMAELIALVEPGVTGEELAGVCAAQLQRRGLVGASGGAHPGLAVSVDDAIAHAPPTARALVEGQVVSLDLAVAYRGYFSDMAVSVGVGEVSDDLRRQLDITRQSLYFALSFANPRSRVGDISHSIQRHLEANGLHPIQGLQGHGIGRALHQRPAVPNRGRSGEGNLLRVGQALALEPAATRGDPQGILAEDGWTVRTRDGSLATHFEHTLVILDHGPEILTMLPGETLGRQ